MLTYNGKTVQMTVVYHDKKHVKEFKLDELDKDLYNIYYTKEGHPDSYDGIQQYICEFTAQKYMLEHGEISDYIGFSQYHRILNTNGNFKFIDNNVNTVGFYVGEDSWAGFEKYRFNDFLSDDLRKYIIKNYKKTDNPYKFFISGKNDVVKYIVNELYFTKYDIFVEMVTFISGFIDYIDEEYGLNGDPDMWHTFILDNFIDVKLTEGFSEHETPWWFENRGRNFWRVIANYIELLEGFYLSRASQAYDEGKITLIKAQVGKPQQ